MSTSYIAAIGVNWPNCQCHAAGDGSVYANLVYDSGDAIPSQATLDAWIAANAVALAAATATLPAGNLVAGTPSAPIAGTAAQFAQNYGGKLQMGQIDPDGIANYVQNALYGSFQFMWLPGPSNGLGISWGATCVEVVNGTGAGKIVPSISATNAVTQMKRLQLSTGTSTSGSDGIVTNSAVCWRGNAAGLGGFLFFARFALETYLASERVFVGLSPNTAYLNAQPSTLVNAIGLCKDSGDTTLQIMEKNASTVTKHDTGVTPNATQILDLVLYCKPNDSKVTVMLMDVITGTVLVNNLVLNTTLPVNTTLLYPQALIQATAGSTSKQLSLAKMYVETET